MSAPLLSAKLVELRQQCGYSQQEVADYLGLTREGYSHYERNTREPNLEIVIKLCELYQIDINELINKTTVLTSVKNQKPVSSTLVGATKYQKSVSSTVIGALARDKFPPFKLYEENPKLISNMNHLLKLLTGKNTSLDLTNITKEDISVLSQYKQLDKQDQKEVRQFIKFKKTISKNKK